MPAGNEGSVDKLLKQIGGFMSDIADDFKIVVVEAIRALCLKFPAKHRSLMNFLSNILREEGGFEYKKAIVQSILMLIKVSNPYRSALHFIRLQHTLGLWRTSTCGYFQKSG